MNKTKVAILISGRGSNMEALAASAAKPGSAAEIATVVSNRPDAQGLAVAHKLGLEAVTIDHRQFARRGDFEQAIARHCLARGVKIIACAGFMRILTADFFGAWRGRILNIHPSLLPSYPGLHTHERALKDGAKIHGCTVHFMSADVDGGPIIAQAAAPVMPGDKPETLARRVLALEHRLYPMALEWLASGAIALEEGRVVYGFDWNDEQSGMIVPQPASLTRSPPSR